MKYYDKNFDKIRDRNGQKNNSGMAKKNITDKAIAELQKLKWTGNIREFRNVLERLIILCDKKITDKDVIAYAQPISK